MSGRTIAVSTLWQIASQVVMAVLSALSVKFVALGLSKELAGSYNSAYGYLQIFAILADFGLYAVSVKEASMAKDKARVLGGLLVLRSIITILSLGAAVAIAWVVPAWRGSPLPMGISIAAFVPFFTLLAGVLRTTFQISYRMQRVFIAEVSQRILTTGLMALILVLGVRASGDSFIYELFLWIGAVGAFLLFLLSFIFSRSILVVRPCFDRVLLLSLLQKSLPFGIAFLCIAIYRQFDLTLIALLRPDYAVLNAEYGFALRITEMTYLVPTFLLNSTLPILAERHERGEDTRLFLGRIFVAVLLLSLTASLTSFFWSRPIMSLLTTDAYLSTLATSGADTALQHLALPMFMNGVVLFAFYSLLTSHTWKPLVSLMTLGVLLSLGLNIFFIPSDGFLGAITTSSVVQCFLACTLLPLSQRVMPFRISRKSLLQCCVFGLCLGAFLAITRPLLSSDLSTLLGCIGLAAFAGGLGFLLKMHKVGR